MPTIRIPIDLTWTGSTGSPGVNIWHGRVDVSEVNPISVNGLAAILEDFYTACAPVFPNDMQIRFAGEVQGVGDDAETFVTADSWVVQGTGGIPHLPPATAMFVNWRAATGGRSGRGRTYLGPLVSADNESNGTPVEQVRGWVQAAADDLIESSDSFGNGALGIYSRTQNVFRDFVSANVPNMFAVLRSRRD